MDCESYIYKEDLLKIAKRLKKRINQKRWSDHSYFLFEKDIHIAFYIIRKLIEAKTKLSKKTLNLRVHLIEFPNIDKIHASRVNSFNLDKFYKLDSTHQITKSIQCVCNQVIHSHIFTICRGEPDTDILVLLNTNKTLEKALYGLSVNDVIILLETVANDYPNVLIIQKGNIITCEYVDTSRN